MRVDLQQATSALRSLDAAAASIDAATSLKVGTFFGRRNGAAMAAHLDAAVGHVAAAADGLRGAGLVQQAAPLGELPRMLAVAATQARDGVRLASDSIGVATARQAITGVEQAVRLPTGPYESQRLEAVHRVGMLLSMSPHDSRNVHEWRQVARDWRDAGSMPELDGLGADALDAVVREVDGGVKPGRKWNGWRVLDRVTARALYRTQVDATRALDQLLARPVTSWTPADWHRLQGLADLPEGVRPVDAPRRGELSEIGREVADRYQHGKEWDGWTEIARLAGKRMFPTPEAAEATAVQLVNAGVDRMSPDDWAVLAAAETRTEGTDRAIGWPANEFMEVAVLTGTGRPVADTWQGWTAIDNWIGRLRHTTPESAERRASQLLDDRSPRVLGADAMHELAGIANLPDGLRPVGLQPDHTYAGAARELAQGKPVADKWQPYYDMDAFQVAHGLGDSRPAREAADWLRVHGDAHVAAAGDADAARAALDDAIGELERLRQVGLADESWNYGRPKVDFAVAHDLAVHALQHLDAAMPQLPRELGGLVLDTRTRLQAEVDHLAAGRAAVDDGMQVRALEKGFMYPHVGNVARMRVDLQAYRAWIGAPADAAAGAGDATAGAMHLPDQI